MPSSTITFPKEGVKFSAFLDFIERCGGKEALKSKRTEEVNAEFLMPCTKDQRMSYCNHLLTTEKKHLVGPAVVFISHAWKFQFLDVVDAIEQHFAEQIATEGDIDSTFFIWFDMFSNNQHITNELDFQWWTGTFKSAIEQFHHTVIILAPWSNPIPFTRAWCLYEIYCSILTGSKLEVALSQKEHDSLIDTLLTDFSSIQSLFGTIDCEKSECFKMEDRLNIFDAVRKTEGFDTINHTVFKHMQEWIFNSLQRELWALSGYEHVEEGVVGEESLDRNFVKYIKLHGVIGQVSFLRGEYEKARDLVTRGLSLFARLSEEDREELSLIGLEMNYYLAEVYYELQQYENASSICEEVFSRVVVTSFNNESSLPPPSVSKKELSLKLLIVVFQGKLLIERMKLREAMKILQQGLVQSKEFLGSDHPVSIQVKGMLGYCYFQQMNYVRAESLLAYCVKSIESQNFSNHLFAIRLKYYYGSLVYKLGDYALSKEMFEICYRAMKVRMGEHHPTTLLYLKSVYAAKLQIDNDVDTITQLLHLLPLFERTFGQSNKETVELLLLQRKEDIEKEGRFVFTEDEILFVEKMTLIFRAKIDINNPGQVLLTDYELNHPIETNAIVERAVQIMFTLASFYDRRRAFLKAIPLYDLVIVYLVNYKVFFDFDRAEPMFLFIQKRLQELLLQFDKESQPLRILSPNLLNNHHDLGNFPRDFDLFREYWSQKRIISNTIDTGALQEVKTMIDDHFQSSPTPFMYETMVQLLPIKKVCYQLRHEGKDHTVIEIHEMLAQKLLNHYGEANDLYFETVNQLIREYHATKEFEKMEKAIQSQLANELKRKWKQKRDSQVTHKLLAYAQFQQRHYTQGFSTFVNRMKLCSQTDRNLYLCCISAFETCLKCHCCLSTCSDTAFGFLYPEYYSSFYFSDLSLGTCLTLVLFLSSPVWLPPCLCYSSRYDSGGTETEERPIYGELMNFDISSTLELPQSLTMNRFGGLEEEEAIFEKSLQHDRMQVILEYARALRRNGRIHKAEKVLSDYVRHSLPASSLGSEGIKGAEVLEYLGDLYCQHHTKYAEALASYERSLAIRRAIQGDTHTDTLSAMYRVGLMQQKLGKYRSALETITAVYRLRQLLLGEKATATRQALDSLVLLSYLNWEFRRGYHYRGISHRFGNNLPCCIFPVERILEGCCCIPIIFLPSCPSSPLAARCWDPVVCKGCLMECCVISPLICCGLFACMGHGNNDEIYYCCNCERAGCCPTMK